MSWSYAMDTIKKVIIEKENYPNNIVRVIKLEPNDAFWVRHTGENFKIGEKYKNYPAVVKDIIYIPQPWYMFWKKKQIYGYFVQWIGEEINKED